MVVIVLALAVAITGYVGWLMWNGPASPPLPPGTSELKPLRDAVARAMPTRLMRQWEHRSTT